MFQTPPPAALSRPVSATVLGQAGERRILDCVEEEAIAFRYNGMSHGVMMATPTDLDEFALGFSLAEGVIETTTDIDAICVSEGVDGIVIDVSLRGPCLHRYLAGRRVRLVRGNTGCGLCGVQDLEDLRRPSARLRAGDLPDRATISSAFERLRDQQPLSRLTRGAHAAAWAANDGRIKAVREDVGRHNALDKLIGAGLRGCFSNENGFCLITSRCSFEMVQKAIAAGFPAIVSSSAPTALAIRTAKAVGLTLCALSRERTPMLFTNPTTLEETQWRQNAS
jgi:FdhD protein